MGKLFNKSLKDCMSFFLCIDTEEAPFVGLGDNGDATPLGSLSSGDAGIIFIVSTVPISGFEML